MWSLNICWGMILGVCYYFLFTHKWYHDSNDRFTCHEHRVRPLKIVVVCSNFLCFEKSSWIFEIHL